MKWCGHSNESYISVHAFPLVSVVRVCGQWDPKMWPFKNEIYWTDRSCTLSVYYALKGASYALEFGMKSFGLSIQINLTDSMHFYTVLFFFFRRCLEKHPLFISRGRVYFPWDRINWIKEVLSNDCKAFLIPWVLLKPVYKKVKERYGKP